jgi:Family of unknown function (DUF5871)
MEYGKPQKLPDGRYFLKISGARHQVNGLVLQDALSTKSVNFSVADPALFQSVDAELLAKAKESKLEWFGKELSDETINNAFQESVTDGVLGASLSTVKGQVITLAFDTKKKPVELETIKENTPCDAVFELSGLWFLKKSFGPIWRVVQIRVRSGAKFEPPKDYLFTDDVEDDQVEVDPADLID